MTPKTEHERMRERLLGYYPEVAHLLTSHEQVRAIHRDKWPRISAYIEARSLAELRDEPEPDWLDFKHGGMRIVTRKSGQATLVI